MVSLAGGLPSTSFFPINEVSFKAPVAPTFDEEFTGTSNKTDIAQGEDVLGTFFFFFFRHTHLPTNSDIAQ